MKAEILIIGEGEATKETTCVVCERVAECGTLVLTPDKNVGICVMISVCQSCLEKMSQRFKKDE